MTLVKSRFSLENKFEPCFTAQLPLYITTENTLFCGRAVDDNVEITILNGDTFSKVSKLTDDDKITSFTVSPSDSTIILGLKNLLLKKVEYPTLKVTKVWRSCHQRPLCKMAINHNGTRLATGSGDTVVRLWHIGPKEGYTASCRGHNSMTTLLSFHPKEPYLFSSALGDYNVAVWSSETGSKVSSLDGHQSTVTAISFSFDGKSIATSGRDKVIITWSCPDFVRQNVIPTFESLEACVYLPPKALANHLGEELTSEAPGLIMSGGQWGCLRVWNPNNGRCVLEIKGPLDRTPSAMTKASSESGKINRESIEYGLHSIVDLQLPMVRSHEQDLAISGSELEDRMLLPKLVLIRQSNHVELYNPMTGKLGSEFLGDIGQVDQLCIVGKNHNRLILADASPHLKIFTNPCGMSSTDKGSWDCHLVPGGHTDVITDLSVSACGEWMVSGSKDQSICLWRVAEHDSSNPALHKKPLVQVVLITTQSNAHAAHVSAICFDKLTRFVISCSEDHVLKVWSLDVTNLRFLPDGTMELETSEAQVLTEWCVVHAAHQGSVNAIDVSVNNQLVATASRDKSIKIWKFGKKQLDCLGVLQGHRRGVWSVCFSTREKIILSASGDGDIKLWNLKDFSCIRTFEGHEQPVYKAVFISNDRQILSCDQKGLVRLWDVSKPNPTSGAEDEKTATAGNTTKVFEAHNGRIWSLAVCPGESGFYTGGEDETLCFFKDVTEQVTMENAKKTEEFVQTKQALDNLVKEKRFSDALRLAIKLDQPKRTLDLLQDLILSDSDTTSSQAGSRFLKSSPRLFEALNGLKWKQDASDPDPSGASEVLIQRLLSYLINWNTRARSAVVAQYVLHWILTSVDPDQLLTWPNFARTVECLLPYTSRHYQRVSRLEEQLAILDYLCDLADEHLVTEVDTDLTKTADEARVGLGFDQNIVALDLSNVGDHHMDVDQ